ncbi:MAG: single-stranded-DNA-specific exonuclease RecJ [Deltaproteobacteria bacterium]|nr:single-stranded-DNA-specific exonuclease RecJ [Deltaproteobacteria bacterium]
MKKRWKVAPVNAGLQAVLARELNILPLTAQLLVNRGLVDADRAFSFLNPELKDLHDPFLLKDMDRAVERLLCALAKGEQIAVYGDYDVDGTTACALLYLFFRDIGAGVVPYIPDRRSEGYGLNAGAVRKLQARGVDPRHGAEPPQGVKVIITVDCGSSNHDEVALANTLGIDVIVTDHHELPPIPPPALAVINPKRHDCPFPFKGLAGVGVAFYLIIALRARLRSAGWFKGLNPVTGLGPLREPNLKKYLDLVCIGTVADMVPLQGSNRVFVSQGLRELENTVRPGLVELKKVAGVSAVDADTIAFQLAPRLNAAGRLGQALTSFKLLTTGDPREAASIAAELDKENRDRQALEEEILNEALLMLEGRPAADETLQGSGRKGLNPLRGLSPFKGIVLHSDRWHPGVIGIVASRLVERFYRPTVMIAFDKDGGQGRGSARGIKFFNLLEGLEACSGLLERFGGHKAAAGLTVRRDKVEAFSAEFLRYLDTALSDEDLVPEVALDAEVKLADFDMKLPEGVQLLGEIGRLAPFGMANAKPLFCLIGASIIQTEIVKEKHLRFKLRQDSSACSGIGFGLARLHPMRGEGYRIAFSPYADEWRGAKNLGLRIKDVQVQPGTTRHDRRII